MKSGSSQCACMHAHTHTQNYTRQVMIYSYLLHFIYCIRNTSIHVHLYKNHKNNEKSYKENRQGYFICVIEFKVFFKCNKQSNFAESIEHVLNRQ